MWDGTETEIERHIKLTLIRHGATKSNLEHRYLGNTDEPLSKEGEKCLQKKRQEGIYQIQAVYGELFISPLLRCRQTAEILFPGMEYQCIPEWEEIDFGSFEGKSYKDLRGNEAYQAWIDSGGTLPFPKGESRDAFKERVLLGFDRMLSYLQKAEISVPKTEVFAVVHGGTNMALCSSFLGGEYFDYQIKCGEGYECHFNCCGKNTELLEMKKIC